MLLTITVFFYVKYLENGARQSYGGAAAASWRTDYEEVNDLSKMPFFSIPNPYFNFFKHVEYVYDFQAELHGTGNRSLHCS